MLLPAARARISSRRIASRLAEHRRARVAIARRRTAHRRHPRPRRAASASGSCQDLVAADCVAAGGTPQGAGSDCATANCPPPSGDTGACCFDDDSDRDGDDDGDDDGDSCEITTAADCEARGGVYRGNGSVCSPEGGCVRTGRAASRMARVADLQPPICVREGGRPKGQSCAVAACRGGDAAGAQPGSKTAAVETTTWGRVKGIYR